MNFEDEDLDIFSVVFFVFFLVMGGILTWLIKKFHESIHVTKQNIFSYLNLTLVFTLNLLLNSRLIEYILKKL